MAWAAETLPPNDGLIEFDERCREKLRFVARDLDANPLPIEALAPHEFEMPACAATMARAKDALEEGIGFAILDDRVPLDGFSIETAAHPRADACMSSTGSAKSAASKGSGG